jgi:hypothetical protein
MALELSEADHRRLDKLLDNVLEAYAKEEVTLNEARGLLAHVFAGAAIDERRTLDDWFKPKSFTKWKAETVAKRNRPSR